MPSFGHTIPIRDKTRARLGLCILLWHGREGEHTCAVTQRNESHTRIVLNPAPAVTRGERLYILFVYAAVQKLVLYFSTL